MQNKQEEHSASPHLYANDAGDTVHIVQPAHELADDRVQPGAEAAAGEDGRVHLIGLEVHPLLRPGTPEVAASRTVLTNNNLQPISQPQQITWHSVRPKVYNTEKFSPFACLCHPC